MVVTSLIRNKRFDPTIRRPLSVGGAIGVHNGMNIDEGNIRDSILGTLQLTAVAVGTDLGPAGTNVLTSGNKASSANYTDDRVNSDPVNYDNQNVFATYKANTAHNGRRMVVVPIV